MKKFGLKQYVEGMVFNIKPFPVKSGSFTSSTYMLIGADIDGENPFSKLQLMNIIILKKGDDIPRNCVPIIIDEYCCCIITNNIYTVQIDKLNDEDCMYLGTHIDNYLSQRKFMKLLVNLYLLNNGFVSNEEANEITARYKNYINYFKKDMAFMDIKKPEYKEPVPAPVEETRISNTQPKAKELTAEEFEASKILKQLPENISSRYEEFSEKYETFIMGIDKTLTLCKIYKEFNLSGTLVSAFREAYSILHSLDKGWDNKLGVNMKYWTDDELFFVYNNFITAEEMMASIGIKSEDISRALLNFYQRRIKDVKSELLNRQLI